MANVLPWEQRVRVLAALLDGNSERAVERMTEVNRGTVGRLVMTLGEGAVRLHDRLVRDLATPLIQMDEIWSYVGKKAARVTEADEAGIGESYTFVAMDTLSRLVIAWRVGTRSQETTDAFMSDVRARLVVMPQITSDGYAPYITAVGASFGPSVDYAQTVKNYRVGSYRGPDHRYEPARDPFVTKRSIFGAPNMARASTAYMERQNCSTRHTNGRLRRLCLAFSKRPDHHRAAVALNYVAYNLTRVIKTLRVTPAMQAGITDHVWTVEELLAALLAEPVAEAPTAKPLAHRAPEAPARALPGGRGFLRLVGGAPPVEKNPPRHDPPPATAPVPQPATPPAAAPVVAQTPAPAVTTPPPAKPATPKAGRPVQLSLFPEGPDQNRPR